MKPRETLADGLMQDPAAFGRLCVETRPAAWFFKNQLPAAFGRLCVETLWYGWYCPSNKPAAFGRLCVETSNLRNFLTY